MKRKIIMLITMLFCITGCAKEEKEIIMPEENPIVTMEIKDYGTITIELYPEYAYNTVANFVNLIEDGFYDNNTIHRVQKDFVIQGGDPKGNGSGGPGYTIEGEFSTNGHSENTLSHTKGVISMARAKDPNSAGSQFFIVLDDNAKNSLDGLYAGFGMVTEGFDILEKIENDNLEVIDERMGILKENLTISKVSVDTKGYTYEVEKY